MKKKLLVIYFLLFTTVAFSQQQFDNFHFSGYKVVIIPSDTFFIDIKNPTLGVKKIDGDMLRLEIIDQYGRVPKDTVIIHTNKLNYIYLHNSQLFFEENIVTDSLKISATSSLGEIDVSSIKLTVNLAAGSHFQSKGKTEILKCNIRAASTFNAGNLISNKAQLNVGKNSQLTVNVKEITHIEKDPDSHFSNVYTKN